MEPTIDQLAEAVGHLQAQLREFQGYAPPRRLDLIDWKAPPKMFTTDPVTTDSESPPPAPIVTCDGVRLELRATLTTQAGRRAFNHRFEYELPELEPGNLATISVTQPDFRDAVIDFSGA